MKTLYILTRTNKKPLTVKKDESNRFYIFSGNKEVKEVNTLSSGILIIRKRAGL